MSSFLDCRYARLTLTDASLAYLKASVFWAGPVWYPTQGFLPSDGLSFPNEVIGTAPLQVVGNHVTCKLVGLSEQEAHTILSFLYSLRGTGRMVVIPRPTPTIPIAIAYNNYALGGTVTASSSATGYAASSLTKSGLYSQVWRSVTSTVTNVTLTADLGSSKDIDLLGLLGFNGSNAATVRLQAGESSTMATTEYDTTSAVSAFDTTLTDPTMPTGRPLYPSFGRHLLYLPQYGASPGSATQTRASWTREAIYCVWDAERPPEKVPLPTVPLTWEVAMSFRVCED